MAILFYQDRIISSNWTTCCLHKTKKLELNFQHVQSHQNKMAETSIIGSYCGTVRISS